MFDEFTTWEKELINSSLNNYLVLLDSKNKTKIEKGNLLLLTLKHCVPSDLHHTDKKVIYHSLKLSYPEKFIHSFPSDISTILNPSQSQLENYLSQDKFLDLLSKVSKDVSEKRYRDILYHFEFFKDLNTYFLTRKNTKYYHTIIYKKENLYWKWKLNDTIQFTDIQPLKINQNLKQLIELNNYKKLTKEETQKIVLKQFNTTKDPALLKHLELIMISNSQKSS